MKKTTVAIMLMMSLLMVNPVVYAADDTQSTSEAGTQSATVTYEQGSVYTVTVPKNLSFDDDKEITYTVTVSGDMKAGEGISVTPDSTVTMVDAKGKDDVTGTITQEKTSFTYDEICAKDAEGNVIGTSTTGTITATDLTAGEWTGTFNFTIAVTSN